MAQQTLLEALVNYESRHFAKARGFKWDNTRAQWLKRVNVADVMDEVKAAKFAIRDLSTGEVLSGDW